MSCDEADFLRALFDAFNGWSGIPDELVGRPIQVTRRENGERFVVMVHREGMVVAEKGEEGT